MKKTEDTTYKVKVYTKSHGGYFMYEVSSMDQAIHHSCVIMESGIYRRVTDAGDFEVWPVYKVKVSGPGLDSEYHDTFVRT